MEKSVEQVKLEKQILEYTALVLAPEDNIGLLGNQPKLRKIREAYKAGSLSEQDLDLVLTNLAATLEGQSESFSSLDQFVKTAFPNVNKPRVKVEKPVLSQAEQLAVIKGVLGEKKTTKYTGPRKKKVKKEDKIDMSCLPASLRHLVK